MYAERTSATDAAEPLWTSSRRLQRKARESKGPSDCFSLASTTNVFRRSFEASDAVSTKGGGWVPRSPLEKRLRLPGVTAGVWWRYRVPPPRAADLHQSKRGLNSRPDESVGQARSAMSITGGVNVPTKELRRGVRKAHEPGAKPAGVRFDANTGQALPDAFTPPSTVETKEAFRSSAHSIATEKSPSSNPRQSQVTPPRNTSQSSNLSKAGFGSSIADVNQHLTTMAVEV